MTVKALIEALKGLPEDATVILQNNDDFYNGFYKATGIDFDGESNEVEIVTDHRWLYDDESGRWVE